MSVTLIARAAAAAAATSQVSRRPRQVSLVQRMTWGANEEELALYRMLGAAGYIQYHLNPAAIDDGAMDNILALPQYNTLGLPAEQFPTQNSSTVANQLQRAMLMRAIYSKRQLLERMVEFWEDHFNIWLNQDGVTLLKTVDSRDVIRANALGNFGTLLRASA